MLDVLFFILFYLLCVWICWESYVLSVFGTSGHGIRDPLIEKVYPDLLGLLWCGIWLHVSIIYAYIISFYIVIYIFIYIFLYSFTA